MDQKDIKSCLKAAREAIRNKDFKEAAKQCKAVLTADPNNYNALVFLGVSAEGLEQTDQALKAYRRAAEQQPDQPLAWQGISSMMEKNPDLLTAEETIKVLQKLIALHAGDATKTGPHLHKLLVQYTKSDQTGEALKIIDQLLSIEREDEKRVQPLLFLISILAERSPKLSADDLAKYESALREVISMGGDFVQEKEDYVRHLLVLISQTKVRELRSACDNLRRDFSHLVASIEFKLRLLLDSNIGEGQPTQEICDTVKELITALCELQGHNPFVRVGQAFLEMQSKNYSSAKDLLFDIPENCISGLFYLSQVYIYLHQSQNCVATCDKGLAACNDKKRILCAPITHVQSLFELAKAEAYLEIGSESAFEKALAILEVVQEKMPTEAFLIKSYVLLEQGKLREAEECLSYLPHEALAVQTLQASIVYARKDFAKALKILQNIVKENATDVKAQLLLGKVLWQLRDTEIIDNIKQECFTTLLRAAKLDPYNYEAFLHIGYFYMSIQKDIVKAKRCFQKSYDLRPGDDTCSSALVGALIELGEEEQSLSLLQKVTSMAPAGCAKWAWLRLGMHQLRHEDPTAAIVSLQSALRADPLDKHVWECLAEAYLQRGSFTASLKAFTKASELNPESVYCLHQIASIKQTLGLAAEAIEDYRNVLQKSPNYVPGLKGISDSLLHLAKVNLNKCLDGLAQDNLQEAIAFTTRGVSQRPDMSCLWKLMGDTCSVAHCLANDSYSVPTTLVGKQHRDHGLEGLSTVSKLELLQIGSRCYNQALKIYPESSSLWHDLGINFYCQSQNYLSESDKVVLLNKASQVMKKAISLQPQEWKHWNALGVIACAKVSHKPGLAQHCFIKSIECESNNVTAWTNLGALYLDKGEIKLAHDAFTVAQSIDPAYMACWIGQALIAEVVGHEEAMDLFRHTTELGFHVESAVSYGHWVLSVLLDSSKRDSDLYRYCIQQMAAVPAASDALVRFTTRVKDNATAFNMQGLLFEHQNLLSSAVSAFNQALTVLDEQSIQSQESNTVRLNIARVLCKQKQYEESVKQYELCDLGDSAEHLCMYGLALLRCNKLEDSREVFLKAMELSQETTIRQSQIHTALGMLTFLQEDIAATKSHLFDSFQTSEPSLDGLKALCALGLLQGDWTLASAVLEELHKKENTLSLKVNLALLEYYKHLKEGDKQEGQSKLSELIAADPADSSLWLLLASLTLRTTHEGDGATVAEFARTALTNETKASEIGNQRLLQCLGQLSAGHHSPADNENNALRNAQKAMHANPGCSSALASLACAVHAEAEITRHQDRSSHLLKVEHGLLLTLLASGDSSDALKLWCLQHLVINAMLQEDRENIKTSLKLLEDNKAQKPHLGIFLQAIEGLLSGQPDTNEITQNIADSLHWLHFMINCNLSSANGDVGITVSRLQGVLSSGYICSKDRVKALWERMAYGAYAGIQNVESSPMTEVFESAVKTLKDDDKPSYIVSLLQALHTKKTVPENARLVKHLLATALDQVDTSRELGYGSSLIRQQLIELLRDSKKDSDQSLVKGLLEDASAKKDTATIKWYKKLMAIH